MNKHSNNKFLVLLSISMTACVSPQYNYTPERTDISEPPIGSVQSAYVGDILLKQGTLIEHEALKLNSDLKVGAIGSYTLRTGYYLKQGETKDSAFYWSSSIGDSGRVDTGMMADPAQSIKAEKISKKLCIISIYNIEKCSAGPGNYSLVSKPIESTDAFQQTLIYSGKIDNKVNIGYREFTGSMARPAFSNDVEYDLKSSNIIGYKGSKIEVIEATNQFIKYKVIKNFNNAD